MEWPDVIDVDIEWIDLIMGKMGEANFCPMANALERKYPGCRPSVGFQTGIGLLSPGDDTVQRYWHTWESKAFILDFDNKVHVLPCRLMIIKSIF